MTEKHKTEEWETAHHKAQQHKTEQHEVEKAAKTAEEIHAELLDCIEASQAGAVQERINALMIKFPELQGAMQIPPEPPPPEGGVTQKQTHSHSPGGTKHKH